ncbi:MAG TPA: chemotaxis protein CheB [Flavitalea sp.]|nr:chemotaxis protein CheB [Flavitalea sp.]
MEENNMTAHYDLVLIGGSAGSIQIILKALQPLLPGNFAVVIVLHRKPSSDSTLIDIFGGKTALRVKEADEKERIQPATVYIAPADYHLLIEKDGSFSLDDSEKVNFSRPSIDITFESAAEVYGSAAVAILLSGASIDGIEGLQKIKTRGGLCIVQDPDTAEVDFLPRQALLSIRPDHIARPDEIGRILNGLNRKPA